MRILPILILGLSIILAGCWGKAGDESSRNEAFEEVMGFAVSPDVKGIESSWVFMKDTYARWLCFSCGEETLARIRNLKATKPARYSHLSESPGSSERNPNAPSWWTGAVAPNEFEEIEVDRTDPSKSIETDIVRIWIDGRTRKVYAERNRWH